MNGTAGNVLKPVAKTCCPEIADPFLRRKPSETLKPSFWLERRLAVLTVWAVMYVCMVIEWASAYVGKLGLSGSVTWVARAAPVMAHLLPPARAWLTNRTGVPDTLESSCEARTCETRVTDGKRHLRQVFSPQSPSRLCLVNHLMTVHSSYQNATMKPSCPCKQQGPTSQHKHCCAKHSTGQHIHATVLSHQSRMHRPNRICLEASDRCGGANTKSRSLTRNANTSFPDDQVNQSAPKLEVRLRAQSDSF